MSEQCTKSDCAACAQSGNCPDEAQRPQSLLERPNALSSVRHVVGVVSGKGGVGKSLVTALLASGLQKSGKRAGVLDADITGPSAAKMFGVHEKAQAIEEGILPAVTRSGLQVISINMLLENEDDPVVWRGPIIASAVKQFWTDTVWHDVDVLFVDLPPGTGDVPLTVFQSLPLDGIIVVTTPQELVSMIVTKATRMAQMMDIPILGFVQNMAYINCAHCHERIDVFGPPDTLALRVDGQTTAIDQLPIDPELARLCDAGQIEEAPEGMLPNCLRAIGQMPEGDHS